MKVSSLTAALGGALLIAFCVSTLAQKDPNWTLPGAEELAAVERANTAIGVVYDRLRNELDPERRASLQQAQRAWIKWRDAEADLIARLGGAAGGSAFRVDFANAQTRLINQRAEVLRRYLQEGELR